MTDSDKLSAIEDEEEEFIDETLMERLVGLTEMFPESVRTTCCKAVGFTWSSTKSCLSFGRMAAWVLASSFTILVLPVLFEKERSALHEQQMQQQRQILLGPNAAMSGQGQSSVMGMMMPPATPQ